LRPQALQVLEDWIIKYESHCGPVARKVKSREIAYCSLAVVRNHAATTNNQFPKERYDISKQSTANMLMQCAAGGMD